ncbi:MAG: hypothetical protein HC838_06825 [Spirulinaceae cyanobacterium RM2_2_10]|nr:hypothetical protein [Spirulinaceae cyanobacterium SM2_1_0]NJO19831.1 hypothetical protein [Spirulinaceae cyanobacterium RM2_2_10]
MMPKQPQRVVTVPYSSDTTKPGALLHVTLEAEQDLVWIWTHFADGRSAVTGYQLQSRSPSVV